MCVWFLFGGLSATPCLGGGGVMIKIAESHTRTHADDSEFEYLKLPN